MHVIVYFEDAWVRWLHLASVQADLREVEINVDQAWKVSRVGGRERRIRRADKSGAA